MPISQLGMKKCKNLNMSISIGYGKIMKIAKYLSQLGVKKPTKIAKCLSQLVMEKSQNAYLNQVWKKCKKSSNLIVQ